MPMRRIARALRYLIPRPWRETVSADLDEEARTLRRGAVWTAWQTMRAATRLRWSLGRDAVMTDLRYAVRVLMHAKGFTLAAVLTLVLGIGINLAVFSVVDWALFRPLPFADIDRLAFLWSHNADDGTRYGSLDRRLLLEARGLSGIDDVAYVGIASAFDAGLDGRRGGLQPARLAG
jgi:hypothetical protein